MTDLEFLERRKQSGSFEVNEMNIKDTELMKLAYEIKLMFQEFENKMLKKSDITEMMANQIKDHKLECELCKGKYLIKDDCQTEWEKCHRIHSENNIKDVNKWWEIAKKIIIATLLIGGGGSLQKIIDTLG